MSEEDDDHWLFFVEEGIATMREVLETDEDLRAMLGFRLPLPALRVLGSGSKSVVFEAPRADLVVRYTRSAPDCQVADSLLGTKETGWVEVVELITMEDPFTEEPACVIVTERVTPVSLVRGDDRKRLYDAIDILIESTLSTKPPQNTKMWSKVDDRTQAWTMQLHQGLQAVYDDPYPEFDHYGDNWGLDRDGNAVWLDFGV